MSTRTGSNRIRTGTLVDTLELDTVAGDTVTVPDPEHLVHLQFRRFAGCPVCNLHLRSVVTRHDEIVAAGVREVVFFHSTVEELRPHVADLPFAVVADPGKDQYVEFGVESGRRSVLDPRALGAIVSGVLHDLGPVLRGRRPLPPRSPVGGRLGLPADFLVDHDGRVLAAHYGEHSYDQWSVDELLDLVRAGRSAGLSGGSQ
jgi:hypothetical protein